MTWRLALSNERPKYPGGIAYTTVVDAELAELSPAGPEAFAIEEAVTVFIVAHEHETGIPLAADQVKTDSRHMSADEMKERNKRWGLFDPERQSIVVVCTGPMLAWDGSPEEYERFYPNAESGAPSVASPSNGD